MNILVTGAAGFIGMHVARALLERGHSVVGLDNFNANLYPAELKRARADQLRGRPGFTGVEGDLCDLERLNRVFAEGRFDAVCHLAAQPGVRYSLENPHAYETANLLGFLNVLEACRHHQVPKLVYASSSSVYGGNTKLPFHEDDPVDHPVSLYAATKKANELMAHTYTHLFGFQTIGLRFFTVYGPWGRPDMAVWSFSKAMLEGRPIRVFNHGDMQRDFTYIDDIRAGVVSCLEATNLDRYEILNIGNHRPENLLDMIATLAGALGVQPKLEMHPMQPGDVPATYADITRIHDKLGFEPTTPISIGFPRFARWYLAWREGRILEN
ncbi:MAG: NAD-dependent epimerase/dehydratase family protein [Kiritimatiellia bacterium]|jgi:UDP-glucuronate 4-epimerase